MRWAFDTAWGDREDGVVVAPRRSKAGSRGSAEARLLCPTDAELFSALCALREAPSPFDPERGSDWRIVHRWLVRWVHQGPSPDDLRQHVVLRLNTSVRTMNATGPAEAKGWLLTVARNLRRDQISKRNRQREWRGMRVIGDSEHGPTPHAVDVLEAQPAERRPEDLAVLADWRDRLFDRVDRWLEETPRSPTKRLGDRQRAQAAWLANVEGLAIGEIAGRLGDGAPRKDTLYKWIERGREEVLLPLIETWEREVAARSGKSAEAEPISVLRSILVAARRADAGRPRPERRRDGPVSPKEHCTSIQQKAGERDPGSGGDSHA